MKEKQAENGRIARQQLALWIDIAVILKCNWRYRLEIWYGLVWYGFVGGGRGRQVIISFYLFK